MATKPAPKAAKQTAAASSQLNGAAPVHDYQAEADVHTLMAAHQIKSDKKRHAAAKAHAKQKLASMKAITSEKAENPAEEAAETPAQEAAEQAAGQS